MATLAVPAKAASSEASWAGAPAQGDPSSASEQRRMRAHALFGTVLAVAGVLSIWPTALLLWSLWITDPLKSIGALVPVVSLLLILTVWRALGWETRASWWGLALLAITIAAVHLRDGAVLELVLSPAWSMTLPPHSLVAFAYASGMVLLLGGTRLWRAALFPLLLVLLVNPVPHVFNRFVDLPLQHASAAVARQVAHALGQRLTPDQLYLMFTPDFGMFIAPGCNGIRGSVTMGLIALVAGYLYRFRWRAWVAVVAGAVLLGYVFNLIRLCALVLYYVVALHVPWLQPHAEGADYCIGAALFFWAAVLLFAAIRRFQPGGDLRLPPPATRTVAAAQRMAAVSRAYWLHWTAGAVLVSCASVPYARGFFRPAVSGAASVRFPAAIGAFRLQRTWPEALDTGQVIFEWAEYALPATHEVVAIGVSPVLGAHDTLLCHTARGEDWLWHGGLELPTRDGFVSFSGSLFNDGATQFLEATTVCSEAGCGQWTSDRTHFGLIYSRPGEYSLGANPQRPVPILLRAETTEVLLPQAAARAQLSTRLSAFAAYASFRSFTYRYQRP